MLSQLRCADAVRTAHLGDETGEECVGGDVEGDAETQVAGALVHLAAQLAFRHKELHTTTCHHSMSATLYIYYQLRPAKH